MFKLIGKKKRGFTLIELIVVIAILAILAAIAIPSFIGITDNADAQVDLANAKNLATAINAYNSLNPDAKLTAEGADTQAALELQNLWPAGLSADDISDAWDNLTISAEGIALADGPAAAE